MMTCLASLLTLFALQPLGSDSFAVREAATVRLEKMLPLSVPTLIVGMRNPDPEIRYRCRRTIQRAYPELRDCDWILNGAVRRLLASEKEPGVELMTEFEDADNWRALMQFAIAARIIGHDEATANATRWWILAVWSRARENAK